MNMAGMYGGSRSRSSRSSSSSSGGVDEVWLVDQVSSGR